MPQSKHPISLTQAWLQDFVIGQNMCPFAKGPSLRDEIRFIVSSSTSEEAWLAELLWECELLCESQVFSTTLWILPNALTHFEAYLDFFHTAEDVIEHSPFADDIQLVSFHPRYCFADAPCDDPANATNQSPFPTIHLLRRNDVAEAIATHPDIHRIPIENAARLRQKASGEDAS